MRQPWQPHAMKTLRRAAMSSFACGREALGKAAGGSVADSGIPPVMKDRASYGGIKYSIKDIMIPEIPELFAAVCVRGDGVPGPEILRLEKQIQFQDGYRKEKQK